MDLMVVLASTAMYRIVWVPLYQLADTTCRHPPPSREPSDFGKQL